jgi:phosphoribosylanthranilate isomerase
MVRVKICGITNVEDAAFSVIAGADALGFVFYKKSPRYISPRKAAQISQILPKRIVKVGVFVDAKEKSIRKTARLCHLDLLQFHGSESPEFCARFKGYKVIKAFRIKDRLKLENVLKYKAFGYLFDTFAKSRAGGTGKKFDWALLPQRNQLKHPIFLSGGLTAKNVQLAIKVVHPDWVDVSSAVEIRPGKKDAKKIKNFITAARK